MVVVEVVMQMTMFLVGPFESQREGLLWTTELIEANPAEKATISINHTHPNSIRVYMGSPDEELPEELLDLAPDTSCDDGEA
jgi:hypothetical protein